MRNLLICAAVAAFAISSAATAQIGPRGPQGPGGPLIIGPSGTYQTYGNTSYGPDGSTQQRYGSQTYVQPPAAPSTTYQTYMYAHPPVTTRVRDGVTTPDAQNARESLNCHVVTTLFAIPATRFATQPQVE